MSASEAREHKEEVPEGWERAFSRSKQLPYFVNKRLGVSVWSVAEAAQVDAKACSGESLHSQKASRVVARFDPVALSLEAFETKVRALVRAFVADEAQTSLELPPCSKEKTFVATELADDHELSIEADFKDVGTHIGKFLTLYRAGHAPSEIRLKEAEAAKRERPPAIEQLSAKRRKKSDTEVVVASANGSIAGLAVTQVGKNKRDRRSIEQIVKDKKSGKQ